MQTLTMDDKSSTNSRNSCFTFISQKLSRNAKVDTRVLQDLQLIHEACDEISKYWDEYDFSPEIQANGYRSFVAKVDLYFKNIRQILEEEENKKSNDSYMDLQLQSYLRMSSLFAKQVHFLHLVRQKDEMGKFSWTGGVYPQDPLIFQGLISVTDEEIRPLLSFPGPFWLTNPGARLAAKLMNDLVTFAYASYAEKIKFLLNRDYWTDRKVQMVQNHSVQSIRNITAIAQKFPYNILKPLAGFVFGTRTKWIQVPIQKDWSLRITDPPDGLTQILFQEPNQESNARATVSCLVIEPSFPSSLLFRLFKMSPKPETLILHAHGSGFVGMCPTDHQMYLREWSRALNAVIVVPDYGKAPENPFPNGIQDLLDVYLHITSGKDKDYNGYKNIILSGDSAGGNLATALLFVLNDMNSKRKSLMQQETMDIPQIVMPTGFTLQFPTATTFHYSPGNVQTCLDTFLPSSLVMTVSSVYCVTNPPMKELWFRSNPQPDLEQIWKHLDSLTPRLKDPYIALFAYDKWQQISHIPLYVCVGEFDPVIDSGILIARKWNQSGGGDVTLDVMSGMPHGFLVLPTARTEAQRVIQGIGKLIQTMANKGAINKAIDDNNNNMIMN